MRQIIYVLVMQDLVAAQLLSEVEEVIQYKLVPERRPVLHEAWHKRLMGCQSVVEDWGRVIQLRRLVLDPRENVKSCLRYAGLCRRSGRLVILTYFVFLICHCKKKSTSLQLIF